jgi:hypothetical protein
MAQIWAGSLDLGSSTKLPQLHPTGARIAASIARVEKAIAVMLITMMATSNMVLENSIEASIRAIALSAAAM